MSLGASLCTFVNCFLFLVSHQWLQDVIALQCSIMRHLSVKQNSSALPADWVSELKTGAKTCATPDNVKPQDSSELNSFPEPVSKPCTTPKAPQGGSFPASQSASKCSTTACQNCWKPNGPLAEERQPPKANGPVDCNSSLDSCGKAELQHRLKPEAAVSELVNHIGTDSIKTEPESGGVEACTQKTSPAAPTIWTHRVQQNHQNQEAGNEAAPAGDKEQSPSRLRSKLPTAGKINKSIITCGFIIVCHISALMLPQT